ncbi:hypothetical protein IJG21_03495 [Candidatus Saccharibacteria bacterium]|nr:hypothetical protein [Candidatus Saccharibacteria bacterium]
MHRIYTDPEKIALDLTVREKEISNLESAVKTSTAAHEFVKQISSDPWDDGFLDGLALNHRADANVFAFLFKINARLHEYEQAIRNEEISEEWLDDIKGMLERTERIRRTLKYLEASREHYLN